jgi:hypothetical protein
VRVAQHLKERFVPLRCLLRDGKQQPAFRSEPLHQRRRREADLARDLGQRQPYRAEARDGAERAGENVSVARKPRPGRHGPHPRTT